MGFVFWGVWFGMRYELCGLCLWSTHWCSQLYRIFQSAEYSFGANVETLVGGTIGVQQITQHRRKNEFAHVDNLEF